MNGRIFFSGAALISADEKGRLSIPASFRAEIPGDVKSRQIFITQHDEDSCLVVYAADQREKIAERLDREEEIAMNRNVDFDREVAAAKYFGPGEVVPIDSSGRFTLPELLHAMAHLGKDILLYGLGDYFQMWDLARLLASDDPRLARQRAAARTAKNLRDSKAAAK